MLSVPLEISLNAQQYTADAQPFSIHAHPRIVSVSPDRGPLGGNTLVRNPLFRVNASSYARCLCTSNPHAGPELPQCIYPNASRWRR